MKTNQKQSLITLLLGVLAGSLLTALISAIVNSATRYDRTWDHAWANSSSPVDLNLVRTVSSVSKRKKTSAIKPLASKKHDSDAEGAED